MDISQVGKKIDDINIQISYKIIKLFSAGLYSSPNKAFEELVCNSYDAFADKVSVYVPDDLAKDGSFIWICDNGEGLDDKELKDLWVIGESKKRLDTQRDKKRVQIGQFGIGKLATYILARKLTYISKKKGRYLIATMDYEKINSATTSLVIDEREVNEKEAEEVINQYLKPYKQGKLEFELFGDKAVDTWTMSILSDLKPKAQEISHGRLKWVLRTALPLNPGFKLRYNGQKIESAKVDVPITKIWKVGCEDATANKIKNASTYIDENEYYLDLEHLKGIRGEFVLYQDSLVYGKSEELGRSHGIFLNIRGRLINLDDPLLGMEPFSHGAFNRTRIMIYADELDANLASTRESVQDSLPLEELKNYIKSKFNNEVRTYYFDEANKEAEKRTISYRLSQTSYTTSKQPIYNFIKSYFNDNIKNPILIEKPLDSEKEELLDLYFKDLETGNQIIEEVVEEPLSTHMPIAKLNLFSRRLTINTLHPYIANYSASYVNTLPLQSIAITEVLTEAHLYSLGISEDIVNNVIQRRDVTLRELALADRDGIPAVAMYLKDSLSNADALEDAVFRVLLTLGFEAVKIGKNGEPDGKAEARLGYTINGEPLGYSLTYDAKSTGKMKIKAATAHLSGLKRHQKKYNADYSLEVAIGYEGETNLESAISQEAKQQKITVIKAKDLLRLLFLVAPKQIGLDKLRELFETCYSPKECQEWVDRKENEDVALPLA